MSKLKQFLNERGRKKSALGTFLKGEAEDGPKDEKDLESSEDTTPKEKVKTVGQKARDKVKKIIKNKDPKEDPNEKEVSQSNELMEYAWENHKRRMAILEKLYVMIRTHLLWGGGEEDEERYGTKNSIDYLGFDPENLTNIFIAIFGTNTKFDQDFEMKNALFEEGIENMDDFIFRRMFGFSKNADSEAVEEKIEDMAKRMKQMPELMNLDKKTTDRIALIYRDILSEEREGKEVPMRRKIQIALDHGIGRKQPTIRFDEEKIAQMITELHNDGRKLDEEPAQTAAAPQPETPTTPTQSEEVPEPTVSATPPRQPQAKSSEKNEQMRLNEAIQKLQGLIEKFRQSSNDPIDLATQVNQTEVAQGNLLGFTFYREKGGSDTPNIKKIIAEHFELEDEAEVDAKIMEIDAEFEEKNIY